MTHDYGQESEAIGIRGEEERQDLRLDTDGSDDAGRIGEGIRTQRIPSNRKNSKEGIGSKDAIGGILAQLLDDAEKQLAKSRECIVWYREEAKEYEQKIENLRKLIELQQEQLEQHSLESQDASPE
ncbi:hypothetical protein D0A34_23675 [Microcoleus vaginatus PCC 9802]|uniref:hypothetical protein n=1 Tax=Microcoleus vaginatus TaxID=119532 RepID=UPI00020D109D|nr:hypothetical protein MicvaDRAFT_1750 [Microcoleus vaginatus FGP-2]UNU21446.1 hypothetical protein D0A34_23675 [Microcoleus vaginatus PCC 9802]